LEAIGEIKKRAKGRREGGKACNVDRETKESAKGEKSLNHPLLPLITLYNPFEFFSFSRYLPHLLAAYSA